MRNNKASKQSKKGSFLRVQVIDVGSFGRLLQGPFSFFLMLDLYNLNPKPKTLNPKPHIGIQIFGSPFEVLPLASIVVPFWISQSYS